jgi:hypothetical protein
MSTARQKLQAQEIPGYRLYWFREDNVDAALEAAYEFVNPEEVHLNQLNVANVAKQSGGTDMGSRVSLVADKNDQGSAVRAYLMKIKLEYYKEDQAEIAKRNASVLEAMFGDEAVQGDVAVDDSGRILIKGRDPLTYVDPERTGIMNRKVRKARSIGRGRLTG